MISKATIDIDRVRKLISYDPSTGLLLWIVGKRRGKVAGYSKNGDYVRVKLDGRCYVAHRLAWALYYDVNPTDQIDHRDNDCANNRIENLREATNSENCRNTRIKKTNTSGFKGVSYVRSDGKWVACIRRDGRQVVLGKFETPEDAARVYRNAAAELFGEFARFE